MRGCDEDEDEEVDGNACDHDMTGPHAVDVMAVADVAAEHTMMAGIDDRTKTQGENAEHLEMTEVADDQKVMEGAADRMTTQAEIADHTKMSERTADRETTAEVAAADQTLMAGVADRTKIGSVHPFHHPLHRHWCCAGTLQ